mmetsp:Transcript_26941/g.82690  ORF Transcript_26941/g.82690 Transcript_26941/m.82690 type:complete len:304 (+) Transcript_26941:605-1516(+)
MTMQNSRPCLCSKQQLYLTMLSWLSCCIIRASLRIDSISTPLSRASSTLMIFMAYTTPRGPRSWTLCVFPNIPLPRREARSSGGSAGSNSKLRSWPSERPMTTDCLRRIEADTARPRSSIRSFRSASKFRKRCAYFAPSFHFRIDPLLSHLPMDVVTLSTTSSVSSRAFRKVGSTCSFNASSDARSVRRRLRKRTVFSSAVGLPSRNFWIRLESAPTSASTAKLAIFLSGPNAPHSNPFDVSVEDWQLPDSATYRKINLFDALHTASAANFLTQTVPSTLSLLPLSSKEARGGTGAFWRRSSP